MAPRTSSSETTNANVDCGSATVDLADEAGGCLAFNLLRVSADGVAGLSSEHRILAAALKLPSSIFAVTADIKTSIGSLFFNLTQWLVHGPAVGSVGSVMAAVRLLMMEAKLCLLPPRVGRLRMSFAKENRADQGRESSAFKLMSFRIEVTILAQLGRADLGMCFIIEAISDG